MRICAFSDRSPEKCPYTLARAEQADLVVVLGDLDPFPPGKFHCPAIGVYGNHDQKKWHMRSGIITVGINPQIIPVCGSSISIVGLSGCRRYRHRHRDNTNDIMDNDLTQEQEEALWGSAPSADMVISHAPPCGINDAVEDHLYSPSDMHSPAWWDALDVASMNDLAHVGWMGGRRYLIEKKPKWWLHGHTYVADDKMSRLVNETKMHYVMKSRIIDPDVVTMSGIIEWSDDVRKVALEPREETKENKSNVFSWKSLVRFFS